MQFCSSRWELRCASGVRAPLCYFFYKYFVFFNFSLISASFVTVRVCGGTVCPERLNFKLPASCWQVVFCTSFCLQQHQMLVMLFFFFFFFELRRTNWPRVNCFAVSVVNFVISFCWAEHLCSLCAVSQSVSSCSYHYDLVLCCCNWTKETDLGTRKRDLKQTIEHLIWASSFSLFSVSILIFVFTFQFFIFSSSYSSFPFGNRKQTDSQ